MIATISEILTRDGEALGELLTIRWFLGAFAAAVVAVVLTRAATWLVHAAWRVGLDRNRALAWWLSVFRLGVLSTTVLLLTHSIVAPAPLLGAALLLAGGAVGVAVLRAQLESLTVGVGLVFRRRLKEGDRLSLGDFSGEVREVGLSRIHLRRADGSSVLLPNRLLNTHPILVERSRHTARVVVRLELPESPTSEVLERLRRAAALSPYRVIGSVLTVTRDPDQPRWALVEMQTHSSYLTHAATRHLEVTLLASLREPAAAAHLDGARTRSIDQATR
ncbi:MAG: mechanosensitive ion channel [Polyangiaceae bacterium]|nr:mechanosensitive ion channel [Polyangiaceae bacterium]